MKTKTLTVNNISKKYELFHIDSSTFLARFFKNSKQESFLYALKGISFTLEKAQILGIFGPNGSGKSTLLKILAGITKPTEGEVIINGKIIAVLELGLGFIKELTAKENIYHAAALMGLSKSKTDKIYHNIVSFSGLYDFMDIQIKYFSSGMFARLAYSLVAHIDADIYLFDEVLAVGDMEFRTKALNKIKALAQLNKSVVIVSHNINEIAEICDNIMVLNKGQIVNMGSFDKVSKEVIDTMFLQHKEHAYIHKLEWKMTDEAPGNDILKITEVQIHGKNKTTEDIIYQEDAIELEIHGYLYKNSHPIKITYTINDVKGYPLTTSAYLIPDKLMKDEQPFTVLSVIPPGFLNPMSFSIDIYVMQLENNTEKLVCVIPKNLFFKVSDNISSKKNDFKNMGAIHSDFEWIFLR